MFKRNIDNVIDTFGIYENPFLSRMKKVEGKRLERISSPLPISLHHSETHEPIGDKVYYAAERTTDRKPFIKLFDECAIILPSLSKCALRIVIHIFTQKLIYRQQVIEFIISDYIKEFSENRKSVYDAVNELIEKEFIARHPAHRFIFFINPDMFFKGERRFLK